MGSFNGFSCTIIACLILCSPVLKCQEIPQLTENDCPGYTLTRNETFDGASLWGYMNGGADIYLEYGFEVMRVEELSRGDESIKMELFKMHNPVSAFGIYGLKTYKCKQDSVLSQLDCLNTYQYQVLYGDYYIQLTNGTGTEKAVNYMTDIANAVLEKLEPEKLVLPLAFLNDSLNIPLSEIKMLKGELGIQNKAFKLQQYFENLEAYQIYYAKTKKAGSNITYYEVVFEEPDMKQGFRELISNGIESILFENKTNILFTLLN